MKNALAFVLLAALGNPSAWGDYHPQIIHPPAGVAMYTFIGQYGETFDFYKGDIVDAEMHGPVEVVRVHPKWDPTQSLSEFPRLFKPGAAAYIPANFEKYDLQELLVIPKGLPGGYKSLDQIKADKLNQAKKSGVIYDVYEVGPELSNRWPAGSFVVSTKVPYFLMQVYTQTPNCFLIYSTGETGADSIGPSLAWSLRRNYSAVSLKPVRQVPHNMILIWLFGNAIFLIISSLPMESWHRRLRLLGLGMLGFSNGMFFLAIALGAAGLSLHLGETLHWGAIFIAVSVLGVLTAAWLTVLRVKPSNPKMVMLVVLAITAFFVLVSLSEETEVLADPRAAYFYSGMLYLCGAFLGLAIGVLSRLRGSIQ